MQIYLFSISKAVVDLTAAPVATPTMIPAGFGHAAFYDHETPHVQQSPEDVTVAHVSLLSLLIGSSDKKKKS